MDLLKLDSKLIVTMTDVNPDEDLPEMIINKLNLIVCIYEDHKEVNDELFLSFIDILSFLDCSRLFEYLIRCHYRHNELIEKIKNEDLVKEYLKINFEETLLKTLIRYKCLKSYHFNEFTSFTEDDFNCACMYGNHQVVKHIYSLLKEEKFNLVKSFNISCQYNQVDVAKWIITNQEYLFDYKYNFINACKSNHLELAIWLQSFNNFDKRIIKNAFIESTRFGSLDTSKWLLTLEILEIEDIIEGFHCSCIYERTDVVKYLYEKIPKGRLDLKETLCSAAINGKLEIVQWIFRVEPMGPNIQNQIFLSSCRQGQINIAKWLYNLNNITTFIINSSFRYASFNANLDVCLWLYTTNLISETNLTGNGFKRNIKEWLDTLP